MLSITHGDSSKYYISLRRRGFYVPFYEPVYVMKFCFFLPSLNPLLLMKSTRLFLVTILSYPSFYLYAQSRVLSVKSSSTGQDYVNSEVITVDFNESVLIFTTFVEYESETYNSQTKAFL